MLRGTSRGGGGGAFSSQRAMHARRTGGGSCATMARCSQSSRQLSSCAAWTALLGCGGGVGRRRGPSTTPAANEALIAALKTRKRSILASDQMLSRERKRTKEATELRSRRLVIA